jgi:hypothetical protein
MCRSVLFVTKWIYSSSYVTDIRGHSGERKKMYTMLLAKAPRETVKQEQMHWERAKMYAADDA